MYFTVKQYMKIGDKVYHPCVCYEAGKELEYTLNNLVSQGKVNVYEERVYFMNGKLLNKTTKKKSKSKAKVQEEKFVVIETADETVVSSEETSETYNSEDTF